MARKGRTRRFREARELKHNFDDGLFPEGDGTLADVDRDDFDESLSRGYELGSGEYGSDDLPGDGPPP